MSTTRSDYYEYHESKYELMTDAPVVDKCRICDEEITDDNRASYDLCKGCAEALKDASEEENI